VNLAVKTGPPRPYPNPSSPQATTPPHMLTAYELAFLKKQEVVGKISLHPATPNTFDTSLAKSLQHP
jgi:hypothetical protein